MRQRSAFSSGFNGCFGVGCAIVVVLLLIPVVIGAAMALLGSH